MDHRRQLIARLYHQGYKTQQQIADELSRQYQIQVTQRTVSTDMKAVRQQWQESAAQEIAEMKAELYSEYVMVKREYWQAWIESKKAKEVETSKQVTGGNGPGGDRLEAQIRKEGQVGDPAFPQGIERVNKAIREMFGVDAAAKIEHGGPGGGPIQIVEMRVHEPVDSQ